MNFILDPHIASVATEQLQPAMPSASDAPDGVHYYESVDEVSADIAKYWLQRHNIFSKYDEGIWLTNDAWFGVTPEPVAK